MFVENIVMLLITFCFSSTGLCFTLNKNCMKTQSYVTRYAFPLWNSSIIFLVFYLGKQKCSSNQCRLNRLKSAVWISVNWSFYLTSLRCKKLVIAFLPFLFFLNHMSVFQCISNLFKVESWNFWRQVSGFTKKNECFLEFRKFTEHLPCVTGSAHTCIHFPFLDNAVR